MRSYEWNCVVTIRNNHSIELLLPPFVEIANMLSQGQSPSLSFDPQHVFDGGVERKIRIQPVLREVILNALLGNPVRYEGAVWKRLASETHRTIRHICSRDVSMIHQYGAEYNWTYVSLSYMGVAAYLS